MSFDQQIRQLPPRLQTQVADYIAFLLQRYADETATETAGEAKPFSFAWRGSLKVPFTDQNGVDLQHEANRLRG